MKRPTLRILIAAKVAALKSAKPKSRDRVRQGLRVLQVAQQIQRERRRAA